MTLRADLIRLANQNPDIRPHILPLLKEAREKQAIDLRKLVGPVFAPVASHFRDEGKFVREFAKALLEWSVVEFIPYGQEKVQFSDVKKAPTFAAGKEVVPQSYWQPVEYAEKEIDVIDAMTITPLLTIKTKDIANGLVSHFRHLLVNPLQFRAAVLEMFQDGENLTSFGNLLLIGLRQFAISDKVQYAEMFEGEITDFVNSNEDYRRPIVIESAKIVHRGRVKAQGAGLTLMAPVVRVTLEPTVPDRSEFDNDYRFASRDKAATNLRSLLAVMFQGVDPFTRKFDLFVRAIQEQIFDNWSLGFDLYDGLPTTHVLSHKVDQEGGVSSVVVSNTYRIPIRLIPARFLLVFQPFLKDRKKFRNTVAEIFLDVNQSKRFAKILAIGLRKFAKSNPGEYVEVGAATIEAYVEQLTEFRYSAKPPIFRMGVGKVVGDRTRVEVNRSEILIHGPEVLVSVGFDSDEPEYDEDPYDRHSRW